MEQWLEAIVRVGAAPVIAMYLLYDTSKRLNAIQIELVKLTDGINGHKEDGKKIYEEIEKLEYLIRESCKK